MEFGYNTASQIVSRDNSNAAFDWTPLSPGLAGYADNNLNQYTSVAAATPTYDTRGNLTSNGVRTFGYDVFNRLTSVSGAGSMTLSYDPAGRLYQTVASSTTTRFLYDGVALVGEYNGSNVLLRRYVHGPAIDEPIVWYEGSGTTDRRWLISDQLGSVTAVTNGAGAATSVNTYDAYGIPNAWTGARFRYTGQTILPEAQLYYYRARVYDPAMGRFLQTDPIGIGGGLNLYAYVANDPLNARDPLGLCVWVITAVQVVHRDGGSGGTIWRTLMCPGDSASGTRSGAGGGRGGGDTGSSSRSEFPLFCPVARVQLSLGAQAAVAVGARGLLGGSAHIDLLSARSTFDFIALIQGRWSSIVTSDLTTGVGWSGSVGISKIDVGVSHTESTGAAMNFGTGEWRDTSQSGESNFVGLDLGLAAVLGGAVQIGSNLTDGPQCPSE